VNCTVCSSWISCKAYSRCVWPIAWAACSRKQVWWSSTVTFVHLMETIVYWNEFLYVKALINDSYILKLTNISRWWLNLFCAWFLGGQTELIECGIFRGYHAVVFISTCVSISWRRYQPEAEETIGRLSSSSSFGDIELPWPRFQGHSIFKIKSQKQCKIGP